MRNQTELTYEWLQDMKDVGTARIVDTKEEGCVQLWEVDDDDDKYVVLSDNTVITQAQDNDMEEIFFPFFLY